MLFFTLCFWCFCGNIDFEEKTWKNRLFSNFTLCFWFFLSKYGKMQIQPQSWFKTRGKSRNHRVVPMSFVENQPFFNVLRNFEFFWTKFVIFLKFLVKNGAIFIFFYNFWFNWNLLNNWFILIWNPQIFYFFGGKYHYFLPKFSKNWTHFLFHSKV